MSWWHNGTRIWFGRTFLVAIEPRYSWGLGIHVLRLPFPGGDKWKIDVRLLCLGLHFGN